MREYTEQFIDFLDFLDGDSCREVAKSLLYWMSEDDVAEYCRVNEIFPEEEEEDE